MDGPGTSRVRYFGLRWDAPRLDGAVQVPTPIGKPCELCRQMIGAGDRGVLIGAGDLDADGNLVGRVGVVHAECELADTMGHTVRICGCTGHPPGRDTARKVWQRVEELRGAPF